MTKKTQKTKNHKTLFSAPPKPPLGRMPRVGEGMFAFSTNAARPRCQRHFVVKGERRGAGKVLTLLR